MKMQLAHDHVAEMMKTHYAKSVQKVILQIPMEFKRGDLQESKQHRRIDIDWWPGKAKESDIALCASLLKYEEKGYRAYTIEQNDLRSSIRIAKSLTALEAYNLMLESRSLTFFSCKNNDIRMLFVPRVGEINSFEKSKYPILSKIKDYTFKSDDLNLQIKKLETSKDKPELQELLNRCKDCKDGYYYPLMGPREVCKTCS